jgi:hypothetical protein
MMNQAGKFSNRFLITIGVLIFITGLDAIGQEQTITEKNIKFIDYPDFPMAHSTWGDIGYNSKYNAVYIGVTNHADSIALYEYSVLKNTMVNKGFISRLANLRNYQWQGKIHTKITMGPDGCMYFATDGGESREEYLMEHPHGYAGSFFMKWDPSSDKLTNLGAGLQYESIKDVDIDFETGNIYAVSYPQVHFLIYNPEENQLRDLGRLGSSHVPRVIFTDSWGNCYYVDWRQRLVMFDKSAGKLLFAKESLPAFPGTPGGKIITGVVSFAKDKRNGIIYLITYGAKIIAFHPQKSGIGKVEDLGGVLPESMTDPLWGPYCPNLNLGDNGKLYYIVGGHGNFSKQNKTLLMEFDPQTKEYKLIVDFSLSQLSEATGSDVKDTEGNLYFAARKDVSVSKAIDIGEGGTEGTTSKPFLIKFNPGKEVKK